MKIKRAEKPLIPLPVHHPHIILFLCGSTAQRHRFYSPQSLHPSPPERSPTPPTPLSFLPFSPKGPASFSSTLPGSPSENHRCIPRPASVLLCVRSREPGASREAFGCSCSAAGYRAGRGRLCTAPARIPGPSLGC